MLYTNPNNMFDAEPTNTNNLAYTLGKNLQNSLNANMQQNGFNVNQQQY